MSKLEAAIAGALSLLLLSSCGEKAPAPAQNGAAAAEADAAASQPALEPGGTGAPTNSADEPVPPPDAVSHPNGYLPPAPGEPEPAAGNSSATDPSGPATEDQ